MRNSQEKILLIDDSTFSRNLMKRLLGSRYQFLEAANGLSGIELFTHEKPDLVILDLTMPDINGIEVLKQMRQMDPHARILVGSADVQSLTQESVMAMGASGFISKPFTADRIQSAVQSLLEETHEQNHD